MYIYIYIRQHYFGLLCGSNRSSLCRLLVQECALYRYLSMFIIYQSLSLSKCIYIYMYLFLLYIHIYPSIYLYLYIYICIKTNTNIYL